MTGKRGSSPIFALIITILIIATVFLTPAKRYLYLAYENLGFTFGFNFNNIATQAYVEWIKATPDKPQNSLKAIFLNQKVPSYQALAQKTEVLGENTQLDDSKWIEVDLSEQRLYLKENDNAVASFLVSTGKWAPTPSGEWRIWTKLRYSRMTGGSKALGTFYDLPNVPYTMYYNQGYGIHGAYWHNNFGNRMSHGCTNMKPEEAAIVYNFASVGTRVIVHD